VVRLAFWPGLLLALALSCGIIGLKDSLSTIAAFLVCSDAFFIPLIDRLLFGRRTQRDISLGLLVGGAGIVLLTLKADFHISTSDCWLLASAVFWAAYTSTVAHAVERQAALPISCACHLIAGLLVGVFAFGFEKLPIALSTSTVFALIYFALIISALRFTLMAKAQQVLTPSEMGLIFLAEPVAAAILGYLVANEILSRQQWIGASLVCLALLIPVILSGRRDRLKKSLGPGHE
jgi:drug/metabolite transporter (DMT)-like permease